MLQLFWPNAKTGPRGRCSRHCLSELSSRITFHVRVRSDCKHGVSRRFLHRNPFQFETIFTCGLYIGQQFQTLSKEFTKELSGRYISFPVRFFLFFRYGLFVIGYICSIAEYVFFSKNRHCFFVAGAY